MYEMFLSRVMLMNITINSIEIIHNGGGKVIKVLHTLVKSVHVLNKISPLLPLRLTYAFLDVFIQSWQFRRGGVSFVEVVLSGHHVQFLCWYRFLVESVPYSRDVV